MMTDSQRTARRQLFLTALVVNVLVFVLSRPSLMARNGHDLIGVVFLAAAMMGIRRDDDNTQRYGVRLEGIFPGREGDPRSLVRTLWESKTAALRELGVAGVIALVVLPFYSLAWPLLNRPVGPRHFEMNADRWREIGTELLAVAFTEEMFFRGYVHTRAGDMFGISAEQLAMRDRVKVVLLTAVMFAITHVTVAPTMARAAVFFPALLFGALRFYRGGIGAGILLHATFNLWERYLEGR
jgi:uncharacterized protein